VTAAVNEEVLSISSHPLTQWIVDAVEELLMKGKYIYYNNFIYLYLIYYLF
jgi:hypothetical protein